MVTSIPSEDETVMERCSTAAGRERVARSSCRNADGERWGYVGGRGEQVSTFASS